MKYIGLDVHKYRTYGTVINKAGEIVRQKEFRNTEEEIGDFLKGLRGKRKAVIESGSCFYPVYNILKKIGVDVVVAHPNKLKVIASAKIKTDKIDSEKLARLLRLGEIPESYIPPEEIRELREIIRHRVNLVRMRAKLKNMIHGILLKEGIKIDLHTPFSKKWVKKVKASDIAGRQMEQLEDYLSLIDNITDRICQAEEELEKLARNNSVVKLLKTVPGISTFSAMVIYSEIVDIKRFQSAKQVASYAGLVPSTRSSGDKTYHGRTTKEGSRMLRWILVQSTHAAVRGETKFRNYYYKKRRSKAPSKAIVATANKLLRTVYTMWLNNEPYIDSRS